MRFQVGTGSRNTRGKRFSCDIRAQYYHQNNLIDHGAHSLLVNTQWYALFQYRRSKGDVDPTADIQVQCQGGPTDHGDSDETYSFQMTCGGCSGAVTRALDKFKREEPGRR